MLARDPAERLRLGRAGRRAVDELASPETFARRQIAGLPAGRRATPAPASLGPDPNGRFERCA